MKLCWEKDVRAKEKVLKYSLTAYEREKTVIIQEPDW